MSLTETGPVPAPAIDEEEAARARQDRINRIAKWTLPSAVMFFTLYSPIPQA